jgi:multidrug resistance efflux pump
MRLGAAAILGVVVLAMLGALVWSQWQSEPLKVSGFIEADEIRVGSRVGGRVAKVAVREGQRVAAGEVLIELDPYDLKERRAEAAAMAAARAAQWEKLKTGFRPEEIAQAKARRDQAEAQLAKLRTGPRKEEIAAAEARVREAEAQLELAQVTLTRITKSFESNAASPDELSEAQQRQKSASAVVDARRQELAELQAGTRAEDIAQAEAQLKEAEAELALRTAGYRAEEIAEAKAALDAATSALAGIDQQLAELNVRSPLAGVIEAVDLQAGDLIAANAPVLSIMDTSDLWVRAYVPENRLNVATGAKVQVSVDSFPGRRFAAHVGFIARQAEFTPNNVQTPQERSKQVFRIKVHLDEGLDVLRPGMSADVFLEEGTKALRHEGKTKPADADIFLRAFVPSCLSA